MVRPFSIIATREVIKLDTEPIFPPIPTRNYDWCAIDENRYDQDYDCERGVYGVGPRGDGATEWEAINGLLDSLEELDDAEVQYLRVVHLEKRLKGNHHVL